MAMYIFYLCTPSGGASSFESFDLSSDDEAPVLALKMLAEHPTCTYVAVWDDERPVLERRRDLDRPTPPCDSRPFGEALHHT